MYRSSLFRGLRQGDNPENSASLTASPVGPVGDSRLPRLGCTAAAVWGSRCARLAAKWRWSASTTASPRPTRSGQRRRSTVRPQAERNHHVERRYAPSRSRTGDQSSKRPHGYRTRTPVTTAYVRPPRLGISAARGDGQLLALSRVRLTTVQCETPSAVRHAPQLAASGATSNCAFRGTTRTSYSESGQTTKLILMN